MSPILSAPRELLMDRANLRACAAIRGDSGDVFSHRRARGAHAGPHPDPNVASSPLILSGSLRVPRRSKTSRARARWSRASAIFPC